MKKVYLTLIIPVLFLTTVMAQKDGIQFNYGASWSELLALAKEKNKLVFLDAYTTWCGPCKQMDRDIFPKQAVAEFYNEMFINAKIDMEKGEGIELSEQYKVNAFPTLLFIAGDGSLVHRAAGFHNEEQFLALGNTAIDPKNRLSSLTERYANGDRDPVFLKNYTIMKFDVADGSHGKIAEDYMNTQEDWGTEDNLTFLFSFVGDTDSKMFDYLLDNRQQFIDLFGQRAVTGRIQELIYASINDTENESSLEQIDRLFLKAYPDKAAELSSRFRMTFFRQAGDRENYMLSAIKHYKKYPSKDQAELNETAWTFFRITKDKKRLKQACKWAKKSIEMDSNYYNNDTLASLYYRLGKKRKAKKTANKAIELAKRDGIDYAPTAELLDKIDGKQPKAEEGQQEG